MKTLILLPIFFANILAGTAMTPDGFEGALWGSPPDSVKSASGATGWQADQSAVNDFPKDLQVTVYSSPAIIAGYRASVKYYFWNDKFFQATVKFNFDELKTFDFNYNVYRSVNDYYTFIRSKTLIFVFDIYDLLRKKYGKKQPIFKGLDPKDTFVKLDKYLKQERWNLRYNPYDYYQHIMTSGYARWDFPKTRVIFSISMAAPEKRFDYTLSAASLDFEEQINNQKDSLRMKGL